MRIAVNALAVHKAAGIGRYAGNVAWSLIAHGNGAEVLVLAREGSDFERSKLLANVTLVACQPLPHATDDNHAAEAAPARRSMR